MAPTTALVRRAALTGGGGGPTRQVAVGLALLVTFLWSTSWILIKVGLEDLPPLAFAALRYGLAALLLWGLVWLSPARARLRALGARDLARLAVLGILLYAVTQGAQFLALNHLPAAALSLTLGFTPTLVALVSWRSSDEAPTIRQVPGIALALLGAVLYFERVPAAALPAVGVAAAGLCLAANSASALLGRRLMRAAGSDPLVVTTISMTVGAALLAAVSAGTEPLPRLDGPSWAIVVWLAAVNTALAFVLWNRTLATLTATESSVLNNTMAIQIPVLAWVALGEALTGRQILGLALAAFGTLWVQLRR